MSQRAKLTTPARLVHDFGFLDSVSKSVKKKVEKLVNSYCHMLFYVHATSKNNQGEYGLKPTLSEHTTGRENSVKSIIHHHVVGTIMETPLRGFLCRFIKKELRGSEVGRDITSQGSYLTDLNTTEQQ